MLNLKFENDKLMMENTQLRSSLAITNQDNKILKLKLGMVQESRDQLETELSLSRAENEELKKAIQELEQRFKMDTPILGEQSVEDNHSVKSYATTEYSKKQDEEPEVFTETGSDFDSRWYKNISIVKSHPNYIVLKNNSRDMHQSLDDFLFSRIVDGIPTVSVAPLPVGIIMPPQSEFTIHANHAGAKEVPSKSCILHRLECFGAGKVTENVILDENGKETANYVICVFQE
ncbi:unnamed protein product [Caenorhabditis brenneri]